MRAATFGLIAAALTACSTTPTLSDSRPIDPKRQLAFATSTAETAAITIIRDSAFSGSAVGYRIYVDGVLAADLWTGESVTLRVAPGERVIEVRHPSSLFGATGDAVALATSTGASYFFRLNSDLGQIKLLRTTAISVGASP